VLLAYWVYILRCENNALYTGYTDDLNKRYEAHCAGRGAKYTRSFKPVEIAQAWQVFIDKSIALKIELYIKGLGRKEKEALITKPERLVDLFGRELICVEKTSGLGKQ
jgi:putative endonuclease